MGIITKTVKIKWNPNIKKWYTDKGYIFTKMRDEFEVNVEDLSDGSHVNIQVECDCKDCKNPIKTISYKNYKRENYKNGEYYCGECYHKIFNKNKKYLNRIDNNKKNFYTIAQWGIDNLGEDFLEKYWSEKNTVNPWEITYGNCKTTIFIKCQKENTTHPDYPTTCNRFTKSTSKGKGCPECALENKTGKNSPKWNGGATNLNRYVRDLIKDWKDDSMKKCNYKCIITGKKFDAIHHLYSLNTILNETMELINLPIHDDISKYNETELDLICNTFLKVHNKYLLGVCLCKDIHNLYHKYYGQGNNTPEQFYEFQSNYHKGLYQEELLKLTI